jgi:hypothetical protein
VLSRHAYDYSGRLGKGGLIDEASTYLFCRVAGLDSSHAFAGHCSNEEAVFHVRGRFVEEERVYDRF